MRFRCQQLPFNKLIAILLLATSSINASIANWKHTICGENSINHTRFAYATLLSSDAFLPGSIVLVESLRLSGTENTIVVMVLPHISLQSRVKLCMLGNIVVAEIDYIENPYTQSMVAKRQRYNFSKLRIWQFIQYERILFLDGDVLVLRNIDELFNIDAELAAAENYNSPYATPPDRPMFNSGVMVIRPDHVVFADLLSKLAVLPSYNGGDQGFLNSYFTNWTELDAGFNANKMQFKYSPGDFPAEVRLRVLHYVRQKPWYDLALQSEKDSDDPLLNDIPSDFEPLNRRWHLVNAHVNSRLSSFSNIFNGSNLPSSTLNKRLPVLKHYWTSDGAKRTVRIWPRFCLREFNLECSRQTDTKQPAGGVTLAIHISSNRLFRLLELVQEWEGPISVALFVFESEQSTVLTQLMTLPLPLHRLDLHLVSQPTSTPFPINLLRNIAIRYARTDLVFLLDVDFQLSPGIYRSLVSAARMDHVSRNTFRRHAFVVPAFEYARDLSKCPRYVTGKSPRPLFTTTDYYSPNHTTCVRMPADKQELLKQWADGAIVPFHSWGLGHRATQYQRWMNQDSPYYVDWEMWYEPYLIFRKSQLDFVPFDERFVDRSRNKLVLPLELWKRGFQFVVLPDVFIVHQWEDDRQLNATRLPRMKYSKRLYQAISRNLPIDPIGLNSSRFDFYSISD